MGLFDFLFGSDESSSKYRGPRKFTICGESGDSGHPNNDGVVGQCDPLVERDGMSGFDSYNDNDF